MILFDIESGDFLLSYIQACAAFQVLSRCCLSNKFINSYLKLWSRFEAQKYLFLYFIQNLRHTAVIFIDIWLCKQMKSTEIQLDLAGVGFKEFFLTSFPFSP